ncbi:hypothetical protein BC826DRAFT_130544 [Russula brevipes]|nr:hypothetical protein BC826DRAFT_130544 [Russula brevipes]
MSTQIVSRCLHLPDEVLVEILSYICPRDIAACQLACRQLNHVVVCSQFLQYLIRVGRSGLYDPMLPGYTIPQRVEALEAWEASWRNLEAQSSFQVKRIVGCELAGSPCQCSKYIIRDDFLIATPISGRDPGYSYIDLRVSQPGGETVPWTRIIKDKLSRKHSTSQFFPEQDLVVITFWSTDNSPSRLIEIQSHGFSFSRGTPHPRFASATITTTQVPTSVDVTIVGNHAILNILSTTSRRVLLHSLNDGRVSQLHDAPSAFSWCCAVLSHDMIALVKGHTETLEVCRIVQDSETSSLRTLVHLGLPPLASQAHFWRSYCIQAQMPVDASSFVVEGRPPRRHPFHNSPEEGTVAIVLATRDPILIRAFTIVTHLRTLVAHATTTLLEVNFIPWEDWGPSGTACFERPIDSLHEVFVGERLAMISGGSLSLFDFNSMRVQNAIRKVGRPSQNAVHSVVKDRVVIPSGETFETNVVSELPYISVVIPKPFNWKDLCNYEEGLAGFSKDIRGEAQDHVNIYTTR